MAANNLPPEVVARARKVRLLIMDCDGVLTDGRLYFGSTGEEFKVFHARDGQGLVNWHAAGLRSGIISGRNSSIVETRAKQLGVEFVLQGRENKVSTFRELIAAAGVTAEETAFIGDDTPDAEVFAHAGLAVAVADAHDAVKASAHYVTKLHGGLGAVRELVDLILEAKK